MRRPVLLTFFAWLVMAAGMATAGDLRFAVKYVSAENVYLNGGSADGLKVGDKLILKKTGGCTTELEIVFVAEHSASCTFAVDSCGIAVGDVAYFTGSNIPESTTSPDSSIQLQVVPDSAPTSPPSKPVSRARKLPARFSGSLAVGYYSWNDRSASNLDFQQSTARLNLKVRRLFGREVTLNFRGRGRYDQRDRSYTSLVDRQAWENRMWELSLSYDEPQSRFNGAVGRILPRRVASAGYLDGALVESHLSEKTRVGLLAGAAPQWAYDPDALSIQKAGAYVTYIAGTAATTYVEQTIAVIGEYHSGDVSRELASLQGRISHGNQWGVYHTTEFDLNRGWRKEKTGNSISLTSVYLNGWYRLSKGARLSLAYDNRTNYWTVDTRSTVDSLFDDHLRQGVRSQLDLSLPHNIQSSLSFGLRDREGEPDPTYSYSVNLSKSTLWSATSRISGQYAVFDGPTEHGYNYSARASDYVRTQLLLSFGLGGYSYRADAGVDNRTSQWIELGGQCDFRRNWFVGMTAQFNSGDDIDGLRLQSEIGMRF